MQLELLGFMLLLLCHGLELIDLLIAVFLLLVVSVVIQLKSFLQLRPSEIEAIVLLLA